MRNLVFITAMAFLLAADPAGGAETCNRNINPQCDDAVQEGIQKHRQDYDRRQREKKEQQESGSKDNLELQGDLQNPTQSCADALGGAYKCN